MKPLHIQDPRAFLLFLALVFLGLKSFCQEYVASGRVTDQENRQALAFVNVAVNEGRYGGMTDINGKYSISSPEPIYSLRFSCLGYEPTVVEVSTDNQKINVALKPTAFQLGEVTIEAGENPAHRIIDSVMAHRQDNHPNSLDSYRYHIYDQLVITIDSSNLGKLLDTIERNERLEWLNNLMQKNDLMVMESYSEVLFQSPDRFRQNVLGTKMSGTKNNQLVYLVSKMQSTSFYDETVSIASADYVNPISKNSKERYFFNLEAVTPAEQGDSLYVISFHPYKGISFNGLRGVMTIHSNGWALQTVKATPEEEGGLYTASIQQLYKKIDGQWFPYQFNTNLVFHQIVTEVDGHYFPRVAIGKSYVSDVELHPVFDKKTFSDIEVMVHEDAAYRDDEFWTQHRIDSLTERVLNTYHMYDTMPEVAKLMDKMLNVTEKMMSESALALGPVDLNLGSMFRLSGMRGWYWGLHLSTNDRFSRHIRLSGFGGYWTKLRGFDYGMEWKWLINRQRQMEMGMRYAHRSDALGEFNGFSEDASILSEKEYKYTFYENILERGDRTEVFFNTRLARHFKAFVTLGVYDKNYHQQYYIQPSDALSSARFATAELRLRFAYKERFVSTVNGLQSLGTDYPVVWLAYKHSFDGILGGQYEYDRLKLQIEKDFQTVFHGCFSMLLQAGYASEGCPVVETFSILGSYEPFGLYSPGCFATMRECEFFSDRFAALFLSYDFQGTLWSPNSQWFRPNLVLATNMGWGDLKQGASHPEMNLSSMDRGFFESGVVVKGLLSTPMVQMGAGVFYRYGPYAYSRTIDNFAFKWSTSFSF